jgi:hypothetical protein
MNFVHNKDCEIFWHLIIVVFLFNFLKNWFLLEKKYKINVFKLFFMVLIS